MTVTHDQSVLVVDYGAQYAQLIARKVRECKVYSEIIPHDTPVDELAKIKPSGLIFSGGPMSVYEEGAPSVNPAVFELGIPILGICYGMQLMADTLGGTVERTGSREYGKTELSVTEEGVLLEELPLEQIVWMSHGDKVTAAPPGFTVTANTAASPVAAMENPGRGSTGYSFTRKSFTHRPAWTY